MTHPHLLNFGKIKICPCQGAEDLLSISETELAGKIRSANVYDMQTVTKCIDLLAEFFSRLEPCLYVKNQSKAGESAVFTWKPRCLGNFIAVPDTWWEVREVQA